MLTGRDKVKVVCCLLQAEFGNLFFVFNFAAQWRPSGGSVTVTSSDNTPVLVSIYGVEKVAQL